MAVAVGALHNDLGLAQVIDRPAHSTITGAEKILVMERGCITEQGTHQELLHSSALYSGLWKSHISAKDTGEEVFV